MTEFRTMQEMFDTLMGWDFEVPEHGVINIDVIPEFYELNIQARDAKNVDVDGIVLSTNDLGLLKSLGFAQKKAPKGQIALKYPAQGETTIIRAIEDSTDGAEHLSPVAIIDPIELSGAIITRVSLKSYRWMTSRAERISYYREQLRKGVIKIDIPEGLSFTQIRKLYSDKTIEFAGTEECVGVGTVITVERSGDVIPTIRTVVSNLVAEIKLPTHCPCCGASVIENGAFLDCENEMCHSKIANRINKFLKVGRVKGLAQKTLVEYADAGIDLIDFLRKDWSGIENKIRDHGVSSLVVWRKVKKQLDG
jgi:DNA ligase (NAD+)